MPVCQECESVLDFDPDEVEEGDIVVCDECGTEFEVVATEPLELSQVDEEGYEDEDEEVAEHDVDGRARQVHPHDDCRAPPAAVVAG